MDSIDFFFHHPHTGNLHVIKAYGRVVDVFVPTVEWPEVNEKFDESFPIFCKNQRVSAYIADFYNSL